MIKIDCNNCRNHCCGKNPYLTPVLLPSEERKFKKNAKNIQTPYREILVLAKKKNGDCIFLNDKTIKCVIYAKRPLECRLYPFLLDFSKEKAKTRLDKRFCPHLKTLTINKKKISALIQKQHFPKEWVNAYNTLKDY